MCLRLHSELIFMVLEWLLITELSNEFKTGYYGGYNFIVSNATSESLNKYDAQNWCRRNGMQLVEIANSDVQNALASFLNSTSSEYDFSASSICIFTGGIRNNLQGWRRLNGSDLSNLSFGKNYNVIYPVATMELSISTGFSIRAGGSDYGQPGYICEDEINCTNNGGFVIDSWCYKAYLSTPWLSWYDSRMQCINRGGDLASFYPIANDQQLNRLNGSWFRSCCLLWIGFRSESWVWETSRSDMKYFNWAFRHPVKNVTIPQDCMCVVPSEWKWQECKCGDKNPFICYSNTTSSTTTSLTAASMPGVSTATAFASNRSNDANSTASPDDSSAPGSS